LSKIVIQDFEAILANPTPIEQDILLAQHSPFCNVAGGSRRIYSMKDEQFSGLKNRLDAIARLLALSIPDEVPQIKKIEALSGTGLQPREIASILGTTSGTVRTALYDLRKAKKIDNQF
jgi:hypothetical protein